MQSIGPVSLMIFVLLAGATPCSAATPSPVLSEKASAPAVQKVPAHQAAFLAKQREACEKNLDGLKESAAQLRKSGCDRFSGERYHKLLEKRDDFCRGILNSAEAQRKYQEIDEAVAAFAERCECRKALDGIRANTEILKKLSAEGCFDGNASYDSAITNVDAIVAHWDKSCKGIVSIPFQEQYVSSLSEFSRLRVKLERPCISAGGCRITLDAYTSAMTDLAKIRADRCKGKLHEALGAALTLKGRVIDSCSAYSQQIVKQLQFYQRQYDGTVRDCTTRDIVMNVRCPWTRDHHVGVHRQVVTFSKDVDVWIHEHWCKEQGDMPWCEQYGKTRVSVEKEFYLFGGSKEDRVDVLMCVSPSEWGKCKAYTSDGKCVP